MTTGGRTPERSCVGCRQRAPKRELVRLVRGPDGVALDPAASAPGRGAYVHRDAACIGRALAKGALARALRTGVDEGELGRLGELIEQTLIEEELGNA
jgi:predicted RNA-binding protein YlxR (DUF448 family)